VAASPWSLCAKTGLTEKRNAVASDIGKYLQTMLTLSKRAVLTIGAASNPDYAVNLFVYCLEDRNNTSFFVFVKKKMPKYSSIYLMMPTLQHQKPAPHNPAGALHCASIPAASRFVTSHILAAGFSGR
jgi:hypothetical protein